MSSRAKRKRLLRPATASNVVTRDFVDGVREGDRFTVLSVREIADKLEAANVPPWRCPACGRKYYLLLPGGEPTPLSNKPCRPCCLRFARATVMRPGGIMGA